MRTLHKRQAELYRLKFYNQSASLKDLAEVLHTSYNYTRAVYSRLMRNPKYRHFDACPECGTKLINKVCPHCGIDFNQPMVDEYFGSHSPVITTLPGGGLGTDEIPHLNFKNNLKVIRNQLDRLENEHITKIQRAQKKGNKKLAQFLPNDPEIHNYATKLLYKEIVEYALKYPSLSISNKTLNAFIENVLNQLKREDKLSQKIK